MILNHSFRISPNVLLLLLLSVLFSSLFLATNKTSAVPTDNAYQTSSSLILKAGTCSRDITKDWSQLILDTTVPFSNYDPNNRQTVYDSFNQSLSSGSWGVSLINVGTNETQISVYWSQNSPLNVTFTDYNSNGASEVFAGNSVLRVYRIYMNQNTCTPFIQNFSDGANFTTSVSDNTRTNTNYFISNANVQYPAGYTGKTVINSPILPLISVDYGINFKYKNAQTDFTAEYLSKTTDPPTDLPDPTHIYWELVDPALNNCDITQTFNRGMNLDGTYNSDSNNSCHTEGSNTTGIQTIVCRAYLPVSVSFSNENCLKWGSAVPFKAPTLERQTYKIYASLGNEIKSTEYKVLERYSSFTVDFSKSAQSGNTELCEPGALAQNETVNCSSPGIYKSCEVLDVKCNLDNFGAFLMDMLTILFVPSKSDITSTIESFNTDTHNIAEVIALPITSIAKLTTASCSPISLSLPFVAKPITLQCLTPIYANAFGSTWAILQVVLTGVVAYGVTINSIAMVKGLKDPQDDKIEVFKL